VGEGTEPLRKYARQLRRNSTEAEHLLWSKLCARQLNGIKFRRQVPLAGYIVDFVALKWKLVIEVDGGQHGEDIASDRERTAALEKSGYHVVRFWNNDVLSNPDGVLDAILQELHLAE
jgi:very-short-patch-repair endonuclease